MTLADTSAWVAFCRDRGKAVADRLESLVKSGTVAVAEPIVMEDAARIYRACRGGGVTPRSQMDCLIAAVAIREQIPVLHQDRDFDLIAECTPLQVVPV